MMLSSREEFEAALDEAQQWAASVGYKEEDVNDIIKAVRLKRRNCLSADGTGIIGAAEA